jgi:hypothetical protein
LDGNVASLNSEVDNHHLYSGKAPQAKQLLSLNPKKLSSFGYLPREFIEIGSAGDHMHTRGCLFVFNGLAAWESALSPPVDRPHR